MAVFSANILLIDVCLIRLNRMAGLMYLPSFFLKAKVPTHHEQAPSYYEKKVFSAFNIHGTGIVYDHVHMYKCVHVFSSPDMGII